MKLPIALSNKHVHLSQADVDALFGEGYQLTPFKPLSQPGQYACEEKVTVVGPKGQQTMRVLGPVRPESQVEVSLADARGLGLSVPVRQSGDIDGTPAFKLVGPNGEVECEKGIIVASRHIHMSLEDAEKFGVKAGKLVENIDESILGGFIINVNNKVIDTSIRRQLQTFKMNLK